MTRFEICKRTRALFGIYKYMERLNENRFAGYDIATICDMLVSIVGVNYDSIDRQLLTNMILEYQEGVLEYQNGGE